MNHLYIDHPGCRVGVRANQLVVSKTDGNEQVFPLRQIDRITVTTQAHFSGTAVTELFRQGVTTLFCSPSGYFRGSFQPAVQGNGQISRRAAQYRLLQQPERALPIAQSLIVAKIRNQQRVVQDWGLTRAELGNHAKAVAQTRSFEQLRGHEGQAAAIYFAALSEKLSSTGFVFTRRERPAADPVNAVLSFGYALLQSEFALAVEHYGMDRFAGFLHASDGSQPSLLLDLMEPFRPLADRLAVRLLTTLLQPDDFVMNNGQCRLRDGSRGHYLKAWENLMNQVKIWQGKHGSYRSLIKRHSGEWAAYLDGCNTPCWWRLSG
jgi:CRISPR-associated protein Cas1